VTTIFGIQSNISSKLLKLETYFKFGTRLCMGKGMTSGHTKNPTKSRDPTIIGIRSNISSKLFGLVTSNLVSGFDCRVLHSLLWSRLWGSTVGYPSDSLASCFSTTSTSNLIGICSPLLVVVGELNSCTFSSPVKTCRK